jgi:hypothetical protein
MKRIAMLLVLAALAVTAAAQVTIIDVIPANMSNEARQDAEPFISYNPDNPNTIVISAFTEADPMSALGPLFVSFDGGVNWVRRDIVPTCMGCWNVNDITHGWAGGRFMAAILSNIDGDEKLLSTTDANLATAMTELATRSGPDQPYVDSRKVFGWFDPNTDRAYVGNNIPGGTQNAKVDQTLDAGAAMVTFTPFTLDARAPAANDNFYVRAAIHPDGTIYGAYQRQTMGGSPPTFELVVRRDNAWAKTAPLYEALSGATGVTVDTYPLTIDFSHNFAGERMAGDLSVAVDPRDSQTVYVSYAKRVSAANPMELHLRRSTNGGGVWSGDLLTVSNAKQSSIAVNSQGHIAYLYQQISGTSPNRHWVTHLRRSADGMIWDDQIMSDFPGEGAGAPPNNLGGVYVADYDKVINIGKNFFGVFSAGNDPAGFPAGVTYLRNHNATQLLRDDLVTPVGVSLDPIFFRTTELAADADVYVRDWTDSAAVRDHGLEPSARNAFYVSSDVWNRRTNDPQPFDANDRPQSEDPHPAAFGHNFAFTRVSREGNTSGQNATVEFLFSDGGVGTNYVSAGTTMLSVPMGSNDATLAAGNGLQWDLPSGASNHVCLATQISTPGDPFMGMTLAGRSPGWPQTDLEILNDNNKAQRNMHVYMGLGGTHGWSMSAIVHNAATRTRDMRIGIDFDLDIRRLLAPKIRFIGGARSGETARLQPHADYVLPAMRPGESRWIEISADSAPDAKGDAIVNLYELEGNRPLNGYAFVFRPARLAETVQNNIAEHAAVIARLAALGQPNADRELARMKELLAMKEVIPGAYMDFVRKSLNVLRARGIELPRYKQLKDPYDIVRRVAMLNQTADPGEFAAQHLTLLNDIDAYVSMLQKQRGDAADVPQLFRVQGELAAGGRFANADLASLAARFIQKPAGVAAARKELMPLLQATAAKSGDNELSARYTAFARAVDAEGMAGAYRDLIWRLEELTVSR